VPSSNPISANTDKPSPLPSADHPDPSHLAIRLALDPPAAPKRDNEFIVASTEFGVTIVHPSTDTLIRVVEGPIANVRGERPDDLVYAGTAVPLRDTWIELRAAMRGVLEQTTLADLVERGRTVT